MMQETLLSLVSFRPMPAYSKSSVAEFVDCSASAVIGQLQRAYAADGFISQYTRQTKVWARIIPELQRAFTLLIDAAPQAGEWSILLEYPLYRLRRRIDLVILAGELVLVVECKEGTETFTSQDARQVEEYGLDLRDFHSESRNRPILPILWSIDAGGARDPRGIQPRPIGGSVAPVAFVGQEGLAPFLSAFVVHANSSAVTADQWNDSSYKPVPGVIEAATSMFSGHNVRSMANFDADNLRIAANRLLELVDQARLERQRYLLILTGVPGSGKTLAGLDVVHSAVATGIEHQGDIVYLSGNTPLVVVLREALTRDEDRRNTSRGIRKRIGDIRRDVRTRIQHINDFLQEGLRGSSALPPHEHVIVFDEAQRAWDEKQGLEKFERSASEPALLLELMSRHSDWCVCICLVGSGQEINSGEEGLFGWGEAMRKMDVESRRQWSVFAPASAFGVVEGSSMASLGEVPPEIRLNMESSLELTVPQRSFRSPELSSWIEHVLAGNCHAASDAMKRLDRYPIVLTRSLLAAKTWLRRKGRGERRYGLLASSGARRLRADGLGTTLNATAGDEIAHWYLNAPGDIRSSFALEVPANEYTCQGLELDLACLCWGGDLLWDQQADSWLAARLSGDRWQRVLGENVRRFLFNSYRVLLSRSREGLVLWIPQGDDSDSTRRSEPLNHTAAFLIGCGAAPLSEGEQAT